MMFERFFRKSEKLVVSGVIDRFGMTMLYGGLTSIQVLLQDGSVWDVWDAEEAIRANRLICLSASGDRIEMVIRKNWRGTKLISFANLTLNARLAQGVGAASA